MKITPEMVEHVAKLARLELAGEDRLKMDNQMANILEYVSLLDELDTSGVPPTSHVIDVENVFREDEVKPSLPVEKGMGNAPESVGTAFKVPKIIEG
ncbi:MAG: Asp-tRNA(Asn)/Glu-tRNA(Gln) amidotransferase subunit GatC [bacterium]